MDELHDAVRERVAGLPDSVRDCPACGGTATMHIRRSSLRAEPCADDVLLKCADCYRAQTHGIPIDRETYAAELDRRGRRVLDFVDDGPAETVVENLAALGYIDY